MLDGADVLGLAVAARTMQDNAQFSGLINAYVAQGWSYQDARIKAMAELGHYDAQRYVWRAEQAWRYSQQGMSREEAFRRAQRDLDQHYPAIPFWHHWIVPTVLIVAMAGLLGIIWANTITPGEFLVRPDYSPMQTIFWPVMLVWGLCVVAVWREKRKAWRKKYLLV